MTPNHSLIQIGPSGVPGRLGSNEAESAGNNLVNFLSKINSADTSNDAKKLGSDLTGTLVKTRSQGMSPIDAFVALIKQTAERDTEYAKVRGRLQSAQASGDKNKAKPKRSEPCVT